MAFQLRPITTGGLIRLALYGESFTGKSHSAVAIARALFPDDQIAIIDTEGKAGTFAGLPNLLAGHLTTYTPEAYLEAIQTVEQSAVKVMIIDSFSDIWDKPGGLLDISKSTRNGRSDSSTRQGWGRASTREKEVHNAIQNSAKHVIVTMRGRAGVNDKTGQKNTPEFIQRDDVTFIFDTMGWMDEGHTLHITKAYAPDLLNRPFSKPGENVAQKLRAHYLTTAAPRWVHNDNQVNKFYEFAEDSHDFNQMDALEALRREQSTRRPNDATVNDITQYTGGTGEARKALQDYLNQLASDFANNPATPKSDNIPPAQTELAAMPKEKKATQHDY